MKRQVNRKKILLVSLFGFIIFLVVGYFFILNTEERTSVENQAENLFPFGDINLGTRGNNNSQNTQGTNNSQNTEGENEEVEKELAPRLRKISDFPTGGFGSYTETEQQQITEMVTDEEGNEIEQIRVIEIEKQKIRYTRIEDGSIFEALIDGFEIIPELIVENFIPNTEYTYFTPNANNVVFQYWNNEERVIETYLGSIQKTQINPSVCPYSFDPVYVGLNDPRIIGLHEFLNSIPQTQLAEFGINSPGNESSLVSEDTITAIKNFQSLYQITIDGQLGQETQAKMKELCDLEEEQKAQERFDNLERKYTLQGSFLPQNIISISMNPTNNTFFYIKKDIVGSIGYIYDFITGQSNPVFESSFTEWLSTWINESTINLNTKPSYLFSGYQYHLNPETQRYFKKISDKNGLLTLPNPNTEKTLVSEIINNNLVTSIYFNDTNQNIPLNIQTFPEKCVWSQDNITLYCGVPNNIAYEPEYPDTWYQGLELFTDSLWIINTDTFEENVVSNLSGEYNESIDIEFIDLNATEEYLYFIEKETEFLWSYRLADY